jgi:MFS family permease
MTEGRGGRDLWLLSTGQLVSVAGDSAALVALLLRMRPHGSSWVAVLLAAELIPFIVCAPFSGRLVDRVETRRVLLAALFGQALIVVPLAVVTAPAATVALFAGLNALSTLVRPATSALIPAIAGPDGAARGYARLATGASVGWIVGPALGGILTGVTGTTAALLLDAASFVIIAAAVTLIRARRPPTRPVHTHPDATNSARQGGLGLLWRVPVLRTALLISAIATGCAVVDNVAAPFRFLDQLDATDLGYGLYLAIWGTGSLAGVRFFTRIPPHRHPTALAVGNLLTGLGIAGIGLAPTLPLALIASLAGGFGNGIVGVTESALIAAHTPTNQHGQAFATAGAIMQTAIGAGTAIAAPLVNAFGAGLAMTCAGGLAAVAAVTGFGRAKPVKTIEVSEPTSIGQD